MHPDDSAVFFENQLLRDLLSDELSLGSSGSSWLQTIKT